MSLQLEPPCQCKPRRLSESRKLACYRTSKVPMGADAKTVARNHAEIRRDMIRMKRAVQLEGSRVMGPMLKRYFDQKLHAVCDRVLHRARQASADIVNVKSPTSVDLGFGGNEEIWRAALDEELGAAADIELMADYLPIVRLYAFAATLCTIGR